MSQTEDKKRFYLIKTLSRTNRKDYENYVINAIYHKLNNINIQPVSQQYVKRAGSNKYALMDLYFPQVNIAVECDEPYHCDPKQKDLDEKRENDIKERLKMVAPSEGKVEIERVDVGKSIEEINERIDEIVKKILKKYESKGSPEWNLDPCEIVEKKRYIEFKDELDFDTIEQVAGLFGKKSSQRAVFYIDKGNSLAWFPKMSIEDDQGNAKQIHPDWFNRISKDRNLITEEYTGTSGDKGKNPESLRYVFGRAKNPLGKDSYRFLGVFKVDSTKDNVTTYKKVGDIVYLDESKNKEKYGNA